MNASTPTSAPVARTSRRWLAAVLALSTALHVWLAAGGGQGYWPDENRYQVSRAAVAALAGGHAHEAVGLLFGSADHLFFRFLGLIPASLERLLFPANSVPPGFAAGFFGLFAVGATALVWLIAREETKDEPTATWCSFFYAGCVSSFFFTRHYFPYDPALCLLLLGWWLGLRSHTPFQHWRTGALVGLGYLTYNAYWNFGAVILVFHVLRPRTGSSLTARGAWAAFGLATPIVAVFAAAHGLGYDLFASAREFSRTVTQGDFGQGWRFIPAYFAATEGGYGLLLLLVSAAGLIVLSRRNRSWRPWLWPAMAAALAMEMVFFSDVLARFALSGRMIKPLAVFLALSAGLAAGRLGVHRSRVWSTVLAALGLTLAAWNFHQPLLLTFPADFRIEAESVMVAERQRQPEAVLQMYYADFMHRPRFIREYPPHVTLLQRRHPLQFIPYQFEGYDAATRRAFQSHDFAMRLVRVTAPAPWQADVSEVGHDLQPHAGAIELTLTLPFPRPAGHTEPLVVVGRPGRADLISLHYLDGEQLELLVDHWGWGAVRSSPFRVPADEHGPQRVVVVCGSLLPPAAHSALQNDPGLRSLADKVVVRWNDREVMRASLPLYHSRAAEVTVGGNYVGGTSAELDFTGSLIAVRQIDPRLLPLPEWGPHTVAGNRPANRLGPLLVAFEWPELPSTPPEETTLFAASDSGRLMQVTTRLAGTGAVFSLWLDGERVAESAPQAAAPGRHALEIWSPLLASTPDLPSADLILHDWLRSNFLLRLDGRIVLHYVQAPTSAPHGSTEAWGHVILGRPWPLDPAGLTLPFRGRILEAGPLPLTGPLLLRTLVGDKLRGEPLADAAPGPLRFTLRFPTGRTGQSEPIFASGHTGAADVLYVVYETDGRFRFGHDRWGWQLLLSEPIALDPAIPHTLDLSMDSLYPAEANSGQGRLWVAVDGHPVLVADRACHPAPLSSLVFGRNLAGASTCGPAFTGELLEISRLDRAALPVPVSP